MYKIGAYCTFTSENIMRKRVTLKIVSKEVNNVFTSVTASIYHIPEDYSLCLRVGSLVFAVVLLGTRCSALGHPT